MKIRTGFVANSSSSSYVCDVCNEVHVGYDLSLRDIDGAFRCAEWHMICCKDFDLANLSKEELVEWISSDKYLKKDADEADLDYDDKDDLIEFIGEGDYPHGVPTKYCPICQLEEVSDNTVLRYLLFKNSTNKTDIVNEIKQKYTSLEEFEKAYRGK